MKGLIRLILAEQLVLGGALSEGAKEVRLPQLGQTMEAGTVVGCMVKVGDEVKKGEVIFEIETDKAAIEMESPADGFVKHITVEMVQVLPTVETLMIVGDKDED